MLIRRVQPPATAGTDILRDRTTNERHEELAEGRAIFFPAFGSVADADADSSAVCHLEPRSGGMNVAPASTRDSQPGQ